MDPDTAARHLAHDDLQHPPGPAGLCVPRRGQRDLLAHRHGARHIVHHPHRAPPRVRAPPRGAVQPGPVLPRRRLARLGGQRLLHRLDPLRLGHLFVADGSARDGEHDELRVGHHCQRRPPRHVRGLSFPSLSFCC